MYNEKKNVCSKKKIKLLVFLFLFEEGKDFLNFFCLIRVDKDDDEF